MRGIGKRLPAMALGFAIMLAGLAQTQAQDIPARALNLQLAALYKGLNKFTKWDEEIRYAVFGIKGQELELFDRYMSVLGQTAGIDVRNARVPERLKENAIVIFLESYVSKIDDPVLQKIFKNPDETVAQMKTRFASYDSNRVAGFCRMVDDLGRIQGMFCIEVPKYHQPESSREDLIWRAVSDLFSIRRAEYLRPSIFNTRPVGLQGDRLGRVDEAIIRSIYDYSIPAGQDLDLALKRVSTLLKDRLRDK